MKLKSFIFFLICCCTAGSWSQSSSGSLKDSLKTAIKSAADDTSKVKLLTDLAFEYADELPDQGIEYGNEAMALAKKLNWQPGIAKSFSVIGSNYAYKADYASALKNEYSALDIFQQLGDKRGEAQMLMKIGVVFHFSGDQDKSLEYYQKSMDKYKLLNDSDGIASVYSNIANAYYRLGKMDKVLESDMASLSIYKQIGNKADEARLLGNIANYYAETGELAASMPYYFDALRKEETLGNRNGVIRNMGNIGETYYDIAQDTSGIIKPDSLIPDGKKANLEKAIFYLNASIDGAREMQQTDLILAFQEVLSDAYRLQGNTDKAFDLYKNYISVRDSVYNIENSKKLLQTQMQYDFDKKAAAAAADQEKKDIRQANLRRSLIGGSGLLLLVIFVLANRNRIKQRSNKQLAAAYKNLKETQDQLVQSEKMAAFGKMASRMSHEIYNPLNFVNNFSVLSKGLLDDLVHADTNEKRIEAAKILEGNIDSILRNGQRATDIIKSLQQQSREGKAHEFFND